MVSKQRLLLAGGLALLSIGLFAWSRMQAPEVYVECAGIGGAVQCTVTHKSGGAGKACWDFVATCMNGATSTASGCETAQPGAKVMHMIPASEIHDSAPCDAVRSAELRNLVVTAP